MRSRAPLALLLGSIAAIAVPSAWAVATDAGPAEPTLPTLPSVAEQVDGLYDADGCLRTGVDVVDCTVRADELDDALVDGGVGDIRHLEGFVGSDYLAEPQGSGPVVLESTITEILVDGSYGAIGLARNAGTTDLVGVDVVARLLGPDGDELAVERATSPVHDLRAGEPAPFTITSEVPATDVASVEWSAAASPTAVPGDRELGWTPYWERPAGGEPVDLYLYADAPGTAPFLFFGSVVNVGTDRVVAPEVVAAWVDADGRVALIATTAVVAPNGEPRASLRAGATADALFVLPAGPPPGTEVLVWAQGS